MTTWTKDEVLEEAGTIRDSVRQTFDKHGGLSQMAWLFATRNPETGEDAKGLVLVPSTGRQGYPDLIRHAGEQSRAVGVVFAVELWAIDPEYQAQIGYEASLKEAREWAGKIAKHPHRIECVHVSVEHHRLMNHMTWTARIARDAEGKPSLGEWDEQTWEGSEGRFTHLLPPVN